MTRDEHHARPANYLEVGFNREEFLLDFAQHYQDSTTVHFHTRITTSPLYAKAMLCVLKDSIEEYEGRFGSIKEEF